MKYVLLSLYLFMLVMTGVAVVLIPDESGDRLVWATDANPVRIEQMNLFRDAYPEHDIMIDPDNTGKQKIITQSLAGMGPDVFDNSGYGLPDFVEAGIAMDLTPIVELGTHPDPGPEAFAQSEYYLDTLARLDAAWKQAHQGAAPPPETVRELQQQAAQRVARVGRAIDAQRLWPIGQAQVDVDGRQYAFPCNIWWCMMAYHRDLFRKAGLPPPRPDWSWGDLLEAARKLTIRDPRTERTRQFGILSLDPYEVACAMGAGFLNETRTVCTFDSPAAVRGYRFYYDLRDKYHVLPTPGEQAEMAGEGGWGGGSINLFAAKHGAMMRFGRYGLINWRLINQRAVERGEAAPLDIGFAPLPRGTRHYYCGGSRICVVNVRSLKRFEALDFLEYLAGPVYGRQINWSADCIPGPIEWTQTRRQVSNPDFPGEHDSDLYWRDQAPNVHEYPRSPFVSNFDLGDIRRYYTDLMGSDLMPVDEAVRRTADDVNARIKATVEEDKDLARRYRAALLRQQEIDRAKERRNASAAVRGEGATWN